MAPEVFEGKASAGLSTTWMAPEVFEGKASAGLSTTWMAPEVFEGKTSTGLSSLRIYLCYNTICLHFSTLSKNLRPLLQFCNLKEN